MLQKLPKLLSRLDILLSMSMVGILTIIFGAGKEFFLLKEDKKMFLLAMGNLQAVFYLKLMATIIMNCPTSATATQDWFITKT